MGLSTPLVLRTMLARITLAAMVAGLLAGCSQSQLDEMADTAQSLKEKAGELPGDAQRLQDRLHGKTPAAGEPSESGGLTIQLGSVETVRSEACFAKLVPAQANRPSILVIQNYDFGEPPPASAVYLRAVVTASSLDALGQATVAAQMFVQSAGNGSIWHTPPQSPVELSISSSSATGVSVSVTGSLLDSDSGTSVNATGDLQAVARP